MLLCSLTRARRVLPTPALIQGRPIPGPSFGRRGQHQCPIPSPLVTPAGRQGHDGHPPPLPPIRDKVARDRLGGFLTATSAAGSVAVRATMRGPAQNEGQTPTGTEAGLPTVAGDRLGGFLTTAGSVAVRDTMRGRAQNEGPNRCVGRIEIHNRILRRSH